jgi:hypothetical protein
MLLPELSTHLMPRVDFDPACLPEQLLQSLYTQEALVFSVFGAIMAQFSILAKFFPRRNFT